MGLLLQATLVVQGSVAESESKVFTGSRSQSRSQNFTILKSGESESNGNKARDSESESNWKNGWESESESELNWFCFDSATLMTTREIQIQKVIGAGLNYLPMIVPGMFEQQTNPSTVIHCSRLI